MTSTNMWEYGHGKDDWSSNRLVGYKVEATDGSIGKIDETSAEAGANRLVVDAGSWLSSRKVMLPAGIIDRVDHDDEKVYVTATKDQVKDSPEYDESSSGSAEYRQSLGDYYGGSRGSF